MPQKVDSCLLPLVGKLTSNVDQQLCQLTLSPLDMKGAPFYFLLQQSTSSINQQLCQMTSSQLNTTGLFSTSYDNNQLVISINNCVDRPCLCSIQKGHLFPSSCNNQPVMLINNCVKWPLLNLIQSGSFLLLLLSKQSTSSIDQQLCWTTSSQLDTKGILSPSSNNNQPVMLINNCVKWPLLNLIQRGSFLLTTIN